MNCPPSPQPIALKHLPAGHRAGSRRSSAAPTTSIGWPSSASAAESRSRCSGPEIHVFSAWPAKKSASAPTTCWTCWSIRRYKAAAGGRESSLTRLPVAALCRNHDGTRPNTHADRRFDRQPEHGQVDASSAPWPACISTWATIPGVTVEKKGRPDGVAGRPFELVDLPGLYSLAPRSRDEMVAVDRAAGPASATSRRVDAVVCIVDASNLRTQSVPGEPGARTGTAHRGGRQHARRGRETAGIASICPARAAIGHSRACRPGQSAERPAAVEGGAG